eukprot:TRINITY_DN20168_c0_g1_i1.p1 TRINITY_DN20168_c0_g1~~TRINITY_DN20168_c0_g1_i1.p1  ORF type:complete len:163 (-),score=18.85 TRINITY_DN20168_c0_g1_i1:142-630(-)
MNERRKDPIIFGIVLAQFVNGVFVEGYDPGVVDEFRKNAECNDIQFYVHVWDTLAGTKPALMSEKSLKDGEGFLLIYSITDLASFEVIPDYHQKIQSVTAENPNISFCLVGNKADLDDRRQVPTAISCTIIGLSLLGHPQRHASIPTKSSFLSSQPPTSLNR